MGPANERNFWEYSTNLSNVTSTTTLTQKTTIFFWLDCHLAGWQEQCVQSCQVPTERRLRLCPQASPTETEEPLLSTSPQEHQEHQGEEYNGYQGIGDKQYQGIGHMEYQGKGHKEYQGTRHKEYQGTGHKEYQGTYV